MVNYAIVSGLFMLFLGIIWRSDSLFNVVIKMSLIIQFVWAVYIVVKP